MPRYRALATFTTYAEVYIVAENAEAAFEIADEMDGGEFSELAGQGGWDIDIFDA